VADPEAAERLKHALRVAMTEKRLDTWHALGFEAGVSPTTIENWIYGRTTPRSQELGKVANVLRPFTSQGKLEAAYHGVPPEEPPVLDALRELIPDLHDLVVILRAQADQAVLEAVRQGLEERRRAGGAPRVTPVDAPSDGNGPASPASE
jgi:hypothetical protein